MSHSFDRDHDVECFIEVFSVCECATLYCDLHCVVLIAKYGILGVLYYVRRGLVGEPSVVLGRFAVCLWSSGVRELRWSVCG